MHGLDHRRPGPRFALCRPHAVSVAAHDEGAFHLHRTGWTRVIVEKPFGRDSESFRQLSADLYEHLTEDQMFRIDHYLGKELIENLTVRKCKGVQALSPQMSSLSTAC